MSTEERLLLLQEEDILELAFSIKSRESVNALLEISVPKYFWFAEGDGSHLNRFNVDLISFKGRKGIIAYIEEGEYGEWLFIDDEESEFTGLHPFTKEFLLKHYYSRESWNGNV